MMMSSMIVTLFFVSRLRMIARFFAVVNCLYGGGGDFAGKIELPAPHNKPLIIRRLPQSRRSKANFASPSLGRGRALMPAPPFPTNLLLRKIFAGALILPQSHHRHSPNDEPAPSGGRLKCGDSFRLLRRHLPQTHPKKILRLFLGTPWEEARE